jgi:hypothetical protein
MRPTSRARQCLEQYGGAFEPVDLALVVDFIADLHLIVDHLNTLDRHPEPWEEILRESEHLYLRARTRGDLSFSAPARFIQ